MNVYFSQKNGRYLNIKEMSTPHIENALAKVRAGKHHLYDGASLTITPYNLLEELNNRNESMIEELKGKVVNLHQRLEDAQQNAKRAWMAHDSGFNRSVTKSHLEDMRQVALRLIASHGLVTADTLRLKLQQEWEWVNFNNFHALAHVFRDSRFKKIGFLQSKIPSNHGRYISVWGSAAAL